MQEDNAYQFSFDSLDGKEIKLSNFKGKVILLVNTASKCGFTVQYKSLEELYKKYKGKGLVVVGVPSKSFGGQEFTDSCDIEDFTQSKFKITFPLTSLYKVRGKEAHPFYKWAKEKVGMIGSPKWNFHKYLIDKNGNLVEWFSSATKPDSEKIMKKIETLI